MSVYYNEIDPFAAAWLRELMKEGAIPNGEIDTRDIWDVLPSDVRGFTQCHWFAGIGGWPLALRLAGWPRDRPIWTGSCPCQPFSTAGKGRAGLDERHLWPAWHWLIERCRPPVVVGEQVEAAIKFGWLDLVHDDLEGIGYAVAPIGLPAASVGAFHIRQRLWFVAKSHDGELHEPEGANRTAHRWTIEGRTELRATGRGGDGLLAESDGTRHARPGQQTLLGGGDRAGQIASAAGRGIADALAHTGQEQRGRRPEEREPRPSDQTERQQAAADDQRCGAIGPLADPVCERRQQESGSPSGDETAHGRARRIWCEPDSDHEPTGDGADGRLADAPSWNALDRGVLASGFDGLRAPGGDDLRPAGGSERAEVGRLADRTRGGFRESRDAPRESGQPLERDSADALGDTIGSRLEGLAGDGRDGDESGRLGADAAGSTPTAGGARVMDDASGIGRRQRGLEEHAVEQGASWPEPHGSSAPGFWDGAIWIPCRDGKARPVEPAIQPLAHGVPNRVGTLRGAGNAIVPQVGAEILRALIAVFDKAEA